MTLSRRDVLKCAGSLAVGAGFGGVSLSLAKNVSAAGTEKQGEIPELPWPYKKLDPVTTAEYGYKGYYKGACSYGVFESIIGQLRKEIGFPYTMMPSTMLVVGQGGMADIGSVCGALNGAASAIFLVTGGMDRKQRDIAYPLIQELFNWHEQTMLPDYKPKEPKFDTIKIMPGSNLCHVSVSKWSKASGFKTYSKERSERCAWITASVARFTVGLLNNHADKAFKAAYPLSEKTKACISCHEKGSELEDTRGLMDCGGCHFTPKTEHPKM